MPDYWDKNKGLMFVRSDYEFDDDSHGGRGAIHKREFEEVANDIFNKKLEQIIPQIEQSAYDRAINALLNALKVDVTTIVEVGMAQGADIFYGKACQTAIMNEVFNTIRNNLLSEYTLTF